MIIEADARYLSHRAKLELHRANQSDADWQEIVEGAENYYRKAVDLAEQNNHRRVNLQIEWADYLVNLVCIRNDMGILVQAFEHIESALPSLDSHQCDACRGYFHFVKSRSLWALASFTRDWDVEHAKQTVKTRFLHASERRRIFPKANILMLKNRFPKSGNSGRDTHHGAT